jgi:hypothetical protein
MTMVDGRGWVATFKVKARHRDGHEIEYQRRDPIVCWWSESGEIPVGLIVGSDGRLHSAEGIADFAWYELDPDAVLSIGASEGWQLRSGDPASSTPLVAWAVTGEGVRGVVGSEEHPRIVTDEDLENGFYVPPGGWPDEAPEAGSEGVAE